ncbi:hypothetical protein TWF694_002203 [Orbilia ellipsospora]|uniref:DUF1690-domain-containing protein n=1 Tax=Orbilia ellipsospora TaxID=2528407 RepID=A0AAV9X1C4_9PEZI
MGSHQSSLGGQHVFQSGQGQVGYNLMDSLQKNSESDSTRERSKNLTIQKKVTEELERLQGKEDGNSRAAEEQISKDLGGEYALNRNTVARSIYTLSHKLHNQSAPPEHLENIKKAETAIVRCLRLNDRRPLDCWKEVEEFKQEVARLENDFVHKIVGNA